MATYRSCRNCGNEERGAAIIQCKSCGTVFCSSCKPGFFSPRSCPACDKHSTRTLGSIE